ncbi:MAG TPA: MFS transporter [Bryobacteraceae bacterium]|nr:MFS transporter [Bryobacteraceae bacterium]
MATQSTLASSTQVRTSQVRRVVRVAAGNALEMYDFQIYGYYAAAIAFTFFPGGNEYASLMLSLATFGAGFLMRPLGAIILGAYIDHHGRRKGLLLTLALMAVGTLSIAILPGYVAIGLAAPLLVLVGRLLQGFSAGVELGGVSVYLSEIATVGRKGFYVAWQSASQQVAVMFAAVLGLALTLTLSAGQIQQWGWRIPFLAGCALIPFLLILRRSLEESDAFIQRTHVPQPKEIARTVLANWPLVLLGTMMATMTTVSFYFVTAYTPTYGANVLHLAATGNLVVTLCVGTCNLLVLPLSGALSDRIGRRPILIACTIAALLTAYPALSWLVSAPSFYRLLTVELWLAFIYAAYNGAMAVYLTEIMPVEVRTSGFSVAYSLATALFGGFTPAICTYLIHATGNPAMPGVWLSLAAACGLTAALIFSYKEKSAQRARNLNSPL